MKSTLKYVSQDTDRHGNVRVYFRKGGKKIRLCGPVNSPDFLEDYRYALLGNAPGSNAKLDAFPTASKGSIRQLCIDYFQSSDFRKLQTRGQRVRRGILERFCQNNNDGDKPYDRLEPSHLSKRRDAMMDRPEAANKMLKVVRQLFKYAMKYEDYDKNPAAVVEYLSGDPDGFHVWNSEEITKFEDTHPIGTTARLAMALALYTGQ